MSANSFFVILLLFTFLLFNCCICQPIALQDFACAKKDANFHNGLFTLIRDNRIRIDPSKQMTNNTGDAPQLDALLLMNAKNKLGVPISIVFVKGGKNCTEFFKKYVQMPTCCIFGDEMEMDDHHAAIGECKEGKKCTFVDVSCSTLPMDPIENLEDLRHFKLSLWKFNVSLDATDREKCEWIAFFDDIRILQTKAGNDVGALEEECWKRGQQNGGVRIVLLVVSLGIILLLIVSMAVLFFYLRRQTGTFRDIFYSKKRKSDEKEPTPKVDALDDPFSSSMSNAGQTSVAAESGVTVPDSLRSDSSSDDDEESSGKSKSDKAEESGGKSKSGAVEESGGEGKSETLSV